MLTEIVHSSAPVTLVGGGDIAPTDLETALALAPFLVAADGGAGAILRAGHVPRAVIGDFDSLSTTDRAALPPEVLHPIAEQDSTDFDKALRNIAAPVVLAVGFLGGRLDHQLAGFSTLLRFPDRPCVMIGASELVFHAPPRLELTMDKGALVSLYPMQPVSGRSQGLHWPIDGLRLEPGGRIGTSNRSTGPIILEADTPGLLAVLPKPCLPQVTQALAALPQTWPAQWPAPA